MKKRLLASLALHGFFGIALIAISIDYFIFGNPVFGVHWVLEVGIATAALFFGIRNLLHALVLTLVIYSGDFNRDANTDTATPGASSGTRVPEYGYRDQWERENL